MTNRAIRHVQFSAFFVALFILSTVQTSLSTAAPAADKWAGADKSVVEKIAKEYGREAREPLINTDQGDLLLFVFLLAGTVGGFAAGYYWRALMDQRRISDRSNDKEKKEDDEALL